MKQKKQQKQQNKKLEYVEMKVKQQIYLEGGEYYDVENKVDTFQFVWYSQDCSSHQQIDNEVIGVEEYRHQLLEEKSVQGS